MGPSTSPGSARLVPILVYPALYQSWYNFPALPRSRIRDIQHVPAPGTLEGGAGLARPPAPVVQELVPILVYPALYQSWYNFPAPPRSWIRDVQHVPSGGVRETCTGFWRDLRSPRKLYQLWYIPAPAAGLGIRGDVHCVSSGVRDASAGVYTKIGTSPLYQDWYNPARPPIPGPGRPARPGSVMAEGSGGRALGSGRRLGGLPGCLYQNWYKPLVPRLV